MDQEYFTGLVIIGFSEVNDTILNEILKCYIFGNMVVD